MSTAIRVSRTAWQTLKELSARMGEPMQAIVDKAVEEYRRKVFLEEANKAYARLREDHKAWQEELEERMIWDRALADDLKDEKQ
jgi:predicted DNA-binding protein